jgi:hypothetical protein
VSYYRVPRCKTPKSRIAELRSERKFRGLINFDRIFNLPEPQTSAEFMNCGPIHPSPSIRLHGTVLNQLSPEITVNGQHRMPFGVLSSCQLRTVFLWELTSVLPQFLSVLSSAILP